MVTHLKVSGKTHYLGKRTQKSKAAHPVNYFLACLAKNINDCPPSKLSLFTSLLRSNHGNVEVLTNMCSTISQCNMCLLMMFLRHFVRLFYLFPFRYNLTGITFYPGVNISEDTETLECDEGWIYDDSVYTSTVVTDVGL